MSPRGAWSALLAAGGVLALGAPATADDDPRLQQQLDLVAQPAVRLEVRENGWVRVPRAALLSAGLDANASPSGLRLFADGVEQPMVVTGDAVEFLGVARDTPWTDTRTYWLTTSAVTGRRVPTLEPPQGAAAPASFVHAEVSTPRKNYLAALLNGDDTNFVGDLVATDGLQQIVAVKHLVTGDAAPLLTVTLQGLSMGAHEVRVSLGGATVGRCSFAARALYVCALPAPGLQEGDNLLTFEAAAADLSMLKEVRVQYPRAFVAEGDVLSLAAPPMTRVSVAGFGSSAVRVLDVTDPGSPVELLTTVTPDGARWTARVDTPSSAVPAPRALLAFTASAVGAVSRLGPSHPSAWTGPLRGQLVILSHADFLDAVRPLAARRAQEGLSVQTIDLQDVYDAFGAGDKSAFAIRAFLGYARAHWEVPPRFVLLVGDASFDARNFLGKGAHDFAPTKLVDTQEMETASDDWFVEGTPIAIGRFPARTARDAEIMVAKTLGWRADPTRGALFVADADEPMAAFSAASAASEAAVAPWLPFERFERGQPGATPEALVAKLQQGPLLVNYFGHGSVEQWDGLFSSAAAAGLTSQQPSIYVNMNCLNGFFHDVYTESLAEALLKAPGGGAVAVWASSTLTAFAPQAAFNTDLLARLRTASLGEAARDAKQAVTDPDVRRTWILFGDPTLRAAPPEMACPDAGVVDAGVAEPPLDGAAPGDAAEPSDARSTSEGGAGDAAGEGVPGSTGCGCQTGTGSLRGQAWLLLLAFLATRRRARPVGPARGARPGQRASSPPARVRDGTD